MRPSYLDIRERIEEKPKWFDWRGVPRYYDFHPDWVSNVYARQAILLLIACQSCGERFLVEMHDGLADKENLLGVIEDYVHGQDDPLDMVSDQRNSSPVHYGDPPNVGCCPAGPTMNCIDIEIVEAWEKGITPWRSQGVLIGWIRRHDLEVPVIEPHERDFLYHKV